jgi:hypothetical protein
MVPWIGRSRCPGPPLENRRSRVARRPHPQARLRSERRTGQRIEPARPARFIEFTADSRVSPLWNAECGGLGADGRLRPRCHDPPVRVVPGTFFGWLPFLYRGDCRRTRKPSILMGRGDRGGRVRRTALERSIPLENTKRPSRVTSSPETGVTSGRSCLCRCACMSWPKS